MRNAKKIAGVLAAMALGVGLVGYGVNASYTSGASAQGNIGVGTFGCSVSSTDPNAVVTGNSITVNNPPILASASGNYYVKDVTVTNTGSMPALVHWTESISPATSSGLWQPTGLMGYTTGTVANNMNTDITLGPGNSQTYGAGSNGVGFVWATLTNQYLGQSFQVVYTANCSEPPPPSASKVGFVGANSGIGAVTLPSFTAGNIAVVEGWSASGTQPPGAPAGYTLIQSLYHSSWSYRVLAAGDTSVPAAGPAGSGQLVAVYSGVAGIGATAVQAGNLNNVGGASFPLKCGALPTMQKTDGSSWVACMGYDGYASTNARTMVFGSNTTNRSASLPDIHTGFADTNGGVSSWATANWTGDNFPLPGSHAVGIDAIELVSK